MSRREVAEQGARESGVSKKFGYYGLLQVTTGYQRVTRMGESDLGAPRLKNRNEDEDENEHEGDGLGRAWMPRELPYPSPGSATSATARKIRDEIEVAPATKPPRSRHSQVTGVGCQGKDLTQRRRQAETQSGAKNVQLTPCRSLSFPCYPMPKHAMLGS